MKRIVIVLTVLLVGLLVVGVAGCAGGVSQAEYDKVKADLTACHQAKAQLETDKTGLLKDKTDLEAQVASLKSQVADLQAKLPKLKDPTYEEAVAFIKEDKTNQEVPWDHALAAILVTENAGKRGLKGYWVIARVGAGWGFNFVGFNTTDKGWVYFCNSGRCSDQEVKLEAGRRLYSLNPAWGTVTFDDMIISIHRLPLF